MGEEKDDILKKRDAYALFLEHFPSSPGHEECTDWCKKMLVTLDRAIALIPKEKP